MASPAKAPQHTELTIGLQDEIRCRAYELYEKRGRQDGYDMEDWLAAESEVIQQHVKSAAA